MNTLRKLRKLGLFLLMAAGVLTIDKVQAQPGVNINFQTFYNELSPYGRWITTPQYGSVWTPFVDQGFQPYSTNGYWEVTEYGNTWVSDYEWGWAPFHYGRWSFDDYTGWFWIPDYEWGPAWVNWRSGGGYYGWAPLGPGMNVNININIPSFWWVFVPQRYISSPRWFDYCAPRNRVTRVYNQTTIINNYYNSNNRTYVYGPRREELERVTRRSIPIRQIDASQRGRVIVDRSSRGNDRFESPAYGGNSRSNSNDRRPNTIDAGGNNSRYSDRPGRDNDAISGNSRGNAGSSPVDNSRNNDRRIENSRMENNAGGNSRATRDRIPEAGFPSSSSDNNKSYEPARPASPARESNVPSYGSERSSRPSRDAAGQGSYNAPSPRASIPERSQVEPRSRTSVPERSQVESRPQSSRSAQESPRGNASSTERSSRSPR